MIKFTAARDNERDYYQPKTFFDCPLCGEKNSFFSVPSKQCHGCMREFPISPRKLMDEENYRLEYHTEGRISDKSQENT
jgi:hypothetical protein